MLFKWNQVNGRWRWTPDSDVAADTAAERAVLQSSAGMNHTRLTDGRPRHFHSPLLYSQLMSKTRYKAINMDITVTCDDTPSE